MPPVTPTLVGRERELGVIAQALDRGLPVLVAGEAGIGKTTLLRAALEGTGRRVVTASAYATLSSIPYAGLRLVLGHVAEDDPGMVARRVEAAVGDGILLLDDAQWLDAASREVAGLLLGRVDIAASTREPSPDLIADAGPGLDWVVVRLGPLADADAADLARRLAGSASDTAIREALRRAAGNPLALEELLRDGRESGSLARAIEAHVGEASAAAQHVLRLLAVADEPLEPARLGPAAQELVALGLAAPAAAGLVVRHALLVERLLDAMPAAERADLHEEVAGLVSNGGDAARHLQLAGRRTEAAARARDALDHEVDLHTRALLLRIVADGAGEDAGPARIAAVKACFDTEDPAGALELLAGPLPGTTEEQALLTAYRAQACRQLGRFDEGFAAVAAARALHPDPDGEASGEAAVEEALLLANTGSVRDAMAVLDAFDAATPGAAPPRRAQRRALRALFGWMAGEPADIDAMRASFAAAVDHGVGTPAGTAANLSLMLLGSEGPGPALAFIDDAEPLLVARHQFTARLTFERIQCLSMLGRSAEAVMAADALLEVPQRVYLRGAAHVRRAEALIDLGRFDEATASLREAEPLLGPQFMEDGDARRAQALLAFWAGRLAQAVTLANAVFEVPTHWAANYLDTCLLKARAQVELGERPDPLFETQDVWIGRGARAEWEALAAWPSPADAVPLFEAAAAAWEGSYAQRRLLCLWSAGECARRAGMPDAIERLRLALAEAEAIGHASVGRRVARSLRLAGDTRQWAPRADSGVGLLTGREREMLDLVARGMSNVEIAHRLGLGRPTIARTLSNAMAKLGVDSRAAAVVMVESGVLAGGSATGAANRA